MGLPGLQRVDHARRDGGLTNYARFGSNVRGGLFADDEPTVSPGCADRAGGSCAVLRGVGGELAAVGETCGVGVGREGELQHWDTGGCGGFGEDCRCGGFAAYASRGLFGGGGGELCESAAVASGGSAAALRASRKRLARSRLRGSRRAVRTGW